MQMTSLADCFKYLRKEKHQFYITPPVNKKGEILFNSLYEDHTTLTLKPDKVFTRKENQQSMYLTNTVVNYKQDWQAKF